MDELSPGSITQLSLGASLLNPTFNSLVQKKVIRYIKFEPFSAPSAPIFQSLKILRLDDTLHLNILTLFIKKLI